jgi:limonene 1,2-monooxygenase
MRFGLFMAPYHDPRHNAALAIQRDLALVDRLDELGYHQVWFGEHHSSGWETIPAPELMIAAAARSTRSIELCTGVISLPYHHPLLVADRIAFLDQLTRGRCVFGFGPGALIRDTEMMGLDYTKSRARMEESLRVILRLLETDEEVDLEAEWFTLRNARLQQPCFTRPRPRLAVAAAVSPTGPKLAGRHGLGLLSFGSTSAAGLASLTGAWAIAEDEARLHDHVVDRAEWALVGLVWVAPTEAAARAQVRNGWARYWDYYYAANPDSARLWDSGVTSVDEQVDALNAAGAGIIGTPDMAVAYLQDLKARTGGFGTFLLISVDFADWGDTSRMLDLFAREVVPHFDDSIARREASYDWAVTNRSRVMSGLSGGWQRATDAYAAERAAR